MIVVDASVAAKLLLDEADSLRTRDWFNDTAERLIAPDLLAVEVAQAVVRRVNMRQISGNAARTVLREWRNFTTDGGIMLVRSNPPLIETAAGLGIDLGHPVKDCLYLALAIECDCDLVTCDAKFVARASPLHPRVRLPGDVS